MRFPRWISILCGISVAVPAVASETITYTYDDLGRLTKVARSGTVNNGANACYSYDPANNRTNVTVQTTLDCAAGAGVSFSISSNGAVNEGTNSVFTVTKTGTASGTLTVNYATSNGTAVAPDDYTTATGTLTFLTSDPSKTVNVPTIDDVAGEAAENFTMTLSAPSGGATLGTDSATGTINLSDGGPPNQPPVAVNDTGTQQKCTTVTYNVTANDTDPEGNYPLVVTAVTGVGFSVYSSSEVQFTSTQGTGNKVGTYTVRDSLGATSTATLTVTVSGGICTQAPAP